MNAISMKFELREISDHIPGSAIITLAEAQRTQRWMGSADFLISMGISG